MPIKDMVRRLFQILVRVSQQSLARQAWMGETSFGRLSPEEQILSSDLQPDPIARCEHTSLPPRIKTHCPVLGPEKRGKHSMDKRSHDLDDNELIPLWIR